MNFFKKIMMILALAIISNLIFAIELPEAPNIKAKAFLVYDVQSRQILVADNLDEKIEPASLTKLMTAYLTFKSLKEGKLLLSQPLIVSNNGYRAEGSRMFLELSKPAILDDVLKGLIVQSGNDAAITLAEAISNSENKFAEKMNQEAKRLGMTNTHFENSTGLPVASHYTSPRDLLILSEAIIKDFPEYYPYYSIKEFTYNKIKQTNRNRLLFRDPTIDGMKTGYTRSAGYNFIVSSIKDGRRLIVIVIGADSAKERLAAAATLLTWSRNKFVNQKIYNELDTLKKIRVYKGQPGMLAVGFLNDVYVSVPSGSESKIKQEIVLNEPLIGKINRGQKVGELLIKIGDETFGKIPIVALQEVQKAGFLRRVWDSIVLFFKRLF